MIRTLIDFALRNRLLILGGALVLFVWGIISFHALPIEAYPDVADTYAQVITHDADHLPHRHRRRTPCRRELANGRRPPS